MNQKIFRPGAGLLAALAVAVFATGCEEDCVCPQEQAEPHGIILINPSPDALAASWHLTGPDGHAESGAGDRTLENLAPGAYTVTWDAVAEWITPPQETLTLVAGATVTFDGRYTEPVFEAAVLVKPDGTGDFPTIQAAVDAVLPRTTIILDAGVFTGPGNRDVEIRNKILTIVASDSAAGTVIDCQDSTRAFLVAEVPYCWIEGITIRNGFPASDSGYGSGAGVFVDDATCVVTACTFETSSSSWGGGVHCTHGGTAYLDGCRFTGNSAATGGAVAAHWGSDLVITGCTFVGNRATRGGAIYSQGDRLVVSGCEFHENTCGSGDRGDGGALCGVGVGQVQVHDSVFARNQAAVAGGGIFLESCGFSIQRCTFWQNSAAAGDAGGISYRLCDPGSISGTIIAASTSGAALVYDDGSWPFCCDFYGNAGGDWVGCVEGADIPELGNISRDPLFCDPDALDFTLSARSPCAPDDDCGGMGARGIGCD
jgi:predicted outer membrane repeat protein